MNDSIRRLPSNYLPLLNEPLSTLYLARVADLSRKEVNDWNDIVCVGQKIQYMRKRHAKPKLTVTVKQAEVLSDGTSVVWLEGVGCVSLSACAPVDQQKIAGTV